MQERLDELYRVDRQNMADRNAIQDKLRVVNQQIREIREVCILSRRPVSSIFLLVCLTKHRLSMAAGETGSIEQRVDSA